MPYFLTWQGPVHVLFSNLEGPVHVLFPSLAGASPCIIYALFVPYLCLYCAGTPFVKLNNPLLGAIPCLTHGPFHGSFPNPASQGNKAWTGPCQARK